ncbi:MAG TPA: NADH-quinone oxidoreductase subunit NuoK [Candidatus Amulumruptor caecigallinarius]|uniref:NADH-quinone oxidoreductase subunit K n=1 Tax=Candidatus Amulumruptor caecigallinarius TaxID=2109911 RepID=A0A921JII6_9BACT|nr:NADH-quinone oxidoreductase subunit NuoK [Candidatus Amulumruptor caecigallinarius]
MDISMIYYLVPTLVMFCCGIYGFITRKNMIAMLISIELMLNAVDINFVIFNRYLFPGQLEGMMFTLFAIAIAAAETALAIAIIINLFRAHKNIDVSDITKMKF